MGRNGALTHRWGECKMVPLLWTTVWQVLRGLSRGTTWLRNGAPGNIPKRNENICPDKNMYMYVHGSIFITSPKWKQPTCPLTDRHVNKMWYFQAAVKGNELTGHEKTQRNFKCIWLSERSQSRKATYYRIPTLWHSRIRKLTETVKRLVVDRKSVV